MAQLLGPIKHSLYVWFKIPRDIGGARNMKLVGPSQSHPQASGSLRMRCRLSQVSILYIIDLLLFYINIMILLLTFLILIPFYSISAKKLN